MIDAQRMARTERLRLVGVHGPASLAADPTPDLFRRLMPRRGEVRGRVGTDCYCVRVAHPDGGNPFAPETRFTRWAAVAVDGIESVPEGMDVLEVPDGDYAVFEHRGPAAAFARTMAQVVGEWLPQSGMALDDRPQFEVLGEDWSPIDPEAREEIWLPVRPQLV